MKKVRVERPFPFVEVGKELNIKIDNCLTYIYGDNLFCQNQEQVEELVKDGWVSWVEEEEQYPCDECGELRTKSEGGTTFTICDKCWEKHVTKVLVKNDKSLTLEEKFQDLLVDTLPWSKAKELSKIAHTHYLTHPQEIGCVSKEKVIEIFKNATKNYSGESLEFTISHIRKSLEDKL